MRNIIILGSGRSGTSLSAGLLAKSGYFMGGDLYPPRDSNPKGFFETQEINEINEELIAQVTAQRPPILGRWFLRTRPVKFQRWLAQVSVNTQIPVPARIKKRINSLTQIEPFCFKDPRFSYTLPCWRPSLNNTVFICIFREPEITVQSILKECRQMKYLSNFSINEGQALRVWCLMYQHILEVHRKEGEWLFFHYNQLLDKNNLNKLANFTQAKVDYTFPDPMLERSQCQNRYTGVEKDYYKTLCELAGHKASIS